ncbi:MAG: hypothetical protein H6729_01340 [Deltaproteobacteria bacterium]|nr:hypothetical protein [Deltaproteobacteria bacterium]
MVVVVVMVMVMVVVVVMVMGETHSDVSVALVDLSSRISRCADHFVVVWMSEKASRKRTQFTVASPVLVGRAWNARAQERMLCRMAGAVTLSVSWMSTCLALCGRWL